jgi:hypothetical protein
MKTIYIDNDYRCHAANPDGAFREVETDAFDGKCDAYINGYRYIPAGESWTREDGEVFKGEMIAPAVDYAELDDVQRDYMLAEYEALINELYSEVTAE